MSNRVFKYDKILGRCIEGGVKKSGEELHYIQDDTIPPTESHATSEGKIFTSRSELYRHYKEHGYECTGGSHLSGKGVADWKHKSSIEDIRNDTADTLNKLRWGDVPTTEKERELCRREEREYQMYKNRQ